MKNNDEKIIFFKKICIMMSITTLQNLKIKFNLSMEEKKDKLYCGGKTN
jgi:hypothetical protein